MKLSISKLESIIERVLLSEYTKEESDLIKEPVLFGELIGKPSHGIIRLGRKNFGAFVEGKKSKPEVKKRSLVSSVVNGNGNCGLLVGSLALKEVIKLAKENGFGIVGTHHSFNSTGALTHYCHEIAKEGLIGIALSQSSPTIAPFGSPKALFGTNPLAFSFPKPGDPIIFDMSTSAISFGDIMKHEAEGKTLPTNVAIDETGNLTNNPTEAKKGGTLPFDNSYKGSGLAMIVELLAGVLPGASFLGLHSDAGWGNMYMAFKPDLLSDKKIYDERIEEFLTNLKQSKTKEGNKIRLPGEQSMKNYNHCISKKEVEVNDAILEKILTENNLTLEEFE